MTKIQLRRGTTSQWSLANPVLSAGEAGWDSTAGKFKLGDGTTTWNSLPYQGDAALNGKAPVAPIAEKAVTAFPSAYPQGYSIMSVGASGWPVDFATVETVRQGANRCFQRVVGKTSGREYVRAEGDADAWGAWNESLNTVHHRGAPLGVASLGSDGKVPQGQLPASMTPVMWATNTSYAAGQKVISPAGDIVAAFEAHNSGSFYNSALYYSDNFGFLCANFTYNSWEGEKLNLFYSADGVTITGHGPNPVYSPATGLRDPSITKIGDTWFMSYGFHSPELKQFAVAKSTDLINWSLVTTINASSVPNLSQAWAPELYQDPTTGSVYIFFTSVWASGATLEVWYVEATNPITLSTWGAPTKLNWTTQPAKAMDPVFTKNGNTWYMFYGDNNYICRATATSLLGPWTADKTGDWAGWGINKEAPQMVRLGPSKWRLYIDRYEGTSPGWTYPGYAYTDSSDLLTWSPLTPVTMGPDNKNKIVLRHGSFIKMNDSITANQVQGAMHSGGSTIRHAEYTTTTTLPNGAETTVAALTLDANRSFNTEDFTLPANGQIKVGATGVYAITVQAGNGANNFGGSGEHWVTVSLPLHDGTLLRAVASSGYELSVSDGAVYLNAGDIIEVKLMQASGASRVVNCKVRVSKVS